MLSTTVVLFYQHRPYSTQNPPFYYFYDLGAMKIKLPILVVFLGNINYGNMGYINPKGYFKTIILGAISVGVESLESPY